MAARNSTQVSITKAAVSAQPTKCGIRPPGAASLGPRLGLDPAAFRREWKLRRPVVTLGRLSFVDALAEIGSVLGSPPDPALLTQIRCERIEEKARALTLLDNGVLSFLDQLLRRCKRVGLISNCFS